MRRSILVLPILAALSACAERSELNGAASGQDPALGIKSGMSSQTKTAILVGVGALAVLAAIGKGGSDAIGNGITGALGGS